MQMKQEIHLDINLEQALANTDFFERRKTVRALIEQGVDLTPQLLEKALATYDFMIIRNVLEYASTIGLKPTTECLNIMIEDRAKVTKKAVSDAWMRGSAVDPSNSIYKLQAMTVRTLIQAGALVTPELIEKSVRDDNNFGAERIRNALSSEELEPTSEILKNEFNRIAEIRKNSRTLAQAFRTGTSIFSSLPKELLISIASLKGNDENVIEENESDVEMAANSFAKL
ncbi:hypothetical protein [Fluoribacter dumoffii]|uniref:Uncharacterized protein n=1 Tax=Fluoribacter dumoffii TaxID=463 RepID=A0A377G6K7_9GAMM|nr:hypothetical protein [Fluoribacter dumoffii]KTC92366.1 hypothetical protein Ldum_0172 [Fluoribacter dumoffii NY 23]STO20404.1 Uncharacterised protein [Fluoribacter dumoffii]